MRISLLALATLFCIGLHAQNCKKIDADMLEQIKTDVAILASDSLEGRETGTQGEMLAMDYMLSRLTRMGLTSYESGGIEIQDFPFQRTVKFDKKCFLALNGRSMELGSDYFPVKYSSELASYYGEAIHLGYGIMAPELEHNDYELSEEIEGLAFIIDVGSPDGIHPHSKFLKYHDLSSRIDLAINRGAAAIILVNQSEYAEDPEKEFKSLISKDIPVVFLSNSEGIASGNRVAVGLKVKLAEDTDLGHNIITHIDNGTKKSIIIGAHYDHLGWGREGSRYMGPPLIHNGADDNGSGSAGLLALAEYLSERPKGSSNYNYILIAFSGEELGLLGSKYFADHMKQSSDEVLCMINYDMIGLLNEDGSGLIINGVGTSPSWKGLLEGVKCKEISYVTTESGVGPSDHTNFYWKEIPAIHFFTGSTTNYHKPSDDAETLNYDGLSRIVEFTKLLLVELNKEEDLEFTKTKEEEQRKRSMKFKVTLGVMPDYAYEGKGLKIDGVIEGKPASNAGLEGGDIVIQLGDLIISDMNAYMTALGVFELGQTVIVKVLRGEEEREFELTF